MTGRRFLCGWLVAVLAAATMVAAAPAQAGTLGQPIHGDMNGDGLTDRVTLGGGGDSCTVFVRLGRAGGGYGPIIRYPYLPPDEPLPLYYCPDMGVYLDLGGDGTPELVLTYFHGPYWGPEVVILRNYLPVGSMSAILRPSVISTADLNGDGLTDMWESTDDQDGFRSWLNTRQGRLVPGPLRIDSMSLDGPPQLVDLDGNGRTDLVATYGLGVPEFGVAVVFDDGTRRQLHASNDTYWQAVVGDVSSDGRPDIRTLSSEGVRETFINRGNRTFVLPPVANDDLAYAYRATPKVIKVRDNDHASTNATLSILTPPRYGRLTKTDPRYEVVYERTATHALPDSFGYRLSQHGRADTATVTVRMKD
jgi:hypothetical protein